MIQLEYHYKAMGDGIDSANYKRATYEIEELNENLALIKQYHNNYEKLSAPFTEQSKLFIETALKSIEKSIVENNEKAVKSNYKISTTNCNSCHASNKVDFINIK
jgi:cytochrome c556